MTIGRIASLALAVGMVAWAAPAHAQSAEAEVLFRQGKKLLKEGKIAEACEKLEASDHVESSVGTLLNLADCREQNRQLASAWAAFHKAAASAKREHDERRELEARRRERLLDARLSYLTIRIAEANRVDGLSISRNGTAVEPALWNQSVPVDAGDYEVDAQAPGRDRWSKRVTIEAEGKAVTVDVPTLEAAKARAPDTRPVVHDDSHPQATPPHVLENAIASTARATTSGTFTAKRKLAVALAVAGAGGVTAGVLFGTHAQDLEKQADVLCPTTACTEPRAVHLNSDARGSALYANVGYLAGGAALAGAVVLWFAGAPNVNHERVALSPVVAPGFCGLSLAGRF